jgi:hypothetical protein
MAHGSSTPYGDCSSFRINQDRVHLSQVNHQATFRESLARNAMPTAMNRYLKVVVASNLDGVYDIIHANTLGYNAGSAINHPVEDFPSLIVGRIFWDDESPLKISLQFIKGNLLSLHRHR